MRLGLLLKWNEMNSACVLMYCWKEGDKKFNWEYNNEIYANVLRIIGKVKNKKKGYKIKCTHEINAKIKH